MPSTKPLFFECFLACWSGPETRNSHHILTIYPTCTLPKHAWNTIVSTKSLFFVRFGIPTEISLKRRALIKFPYGITPAPCQNSPETQCCPQKQRFRHGFWWVEISLKREALVKFNNFINFAASQNGPETRCCRQKQRFFMFRDSCSLSLSARFNPLS